MQKTYNVLKDYTSETTAYLYALLTKILSEQECVNIALSGGSTPLPIYKELFNTDLDWRRINVFLVDDRCVRDDSPGSNYGNIKVLAEKIIIKNFYPIYHESMGYENSAIQYNDLLKEHLLISNGFPKFDLIILGMGEDGHTASLFPDSSSLNEIKKWVIYTQVEDGYKDRITMTYPVLLNAKEIVVLAKGKIKKKIISDIHNTKNYPIAKIAKEAKSLQWIID